MRALVVTIWVFINLIFFGMCVYMYLLWSQYWMYINQDVLTTTTNYEQQIFNYNRGLPLNETRYEIGKKRQKHHALIDPSSINVTIIKNSRPRFPNLQGGDDFHYETHKYQCYSNETVADCERKLGNYKQKILMELKRVFMDEGNVLKSDQNPYNVNYRGPRENHLNKDRIDLECQFKKVRVDTIQRTDYPFSEHPYRDLLPAQGFLQDGNKFKSCAVVTSSGALRNSRLGKYIDGHHLVLRFNNAPTKGYERDVGRKTTVRILNSQVISKSEFGFLNSELYKNITIVAWDPSNYTSTLDQWMKKPDFDLFTNYWNFRKNNQKNDAYLLNPKSLWNLWDFLQSNSPSRLRRNPISSGFLGLALLLPHCEFVTMFEYMPSNRVTKRCHYYDEEQNAACTFGVWHPLAAEKLLTYSLNIANDRQVFQTGFVKVPGFNQITCPS